MGFGEEDPVLWLFVCGRKKLSFKSYTCVIGFKLGGLCEYADYDYLIKLLIGDNSEFFLDSIQCFLYSSLIVNYYY